MIVDRGGNPLAAGFSREIPPSPSDVHAEELALRRLQERKKHDDLAIGATLYSSLEPCSTRLSGATSCTQLIIASGIRRVVYAMVEPPLLVVCEGDQLLREAGIEVEHLSSLHDEAASVVLSAFEKK